VLKKIEKIALNNNSETDSKPKPIVSKSFGAHIDSNNDNHKEFPFKDSLKFIRHAPAVSKSEDLSKVIIEKIKKWIKILTLEFFSQKIYIIICDLRTFYPLQEYR
jgi:hypothetical protein